MKEKGVGMTNKKKREASTEDEGATESGEDQKIYLDDVTSSLDEKELFIQQFMVKEGLSEPYYIEAVFLSKKSDISPEDLMGKEVTIKMIYKNIPEVEEVENEG